MKKLFIFTLLIGAIGYSASAQRLTARTYVEKTQINLKNGFAMGFLFKNDAEAGAFYQKSAGFGEGSDAPLPRFFEHELMGIYAAYPIYNTRTFDVKYQVRTGVSNGQNFAITSSILADYTILNRFKIGAGIGSRNFSPTLQSSLTVML